MAAIRDMKNAGCVVAAVAKNHQRKRNNITYRVSDEKDYASA
jgi:hypothetical protein